MDVRFVIVSPAAKKAAHAVRLPIVVGRSDDAKFRIRQDSVSRRHCEFFEKDAAVHVRDLGSTNGTLVDGERIASSVAALVRPGAEVRVGTFVFRVEYEGADLAEAVPADRGEDTVPMAAHDETAAVDDLPLAEPAVAGDDIDLPATDEPPLAEPADEPPTAGWPGAVDDPPAAAGDDKLDDFFKSLK